MTEDREMLTSEQAAEWLQVTQETIYRWIQKGELPALKVGRVYRIPRGEVLAMVRRQDGTDAPEEDGLDRDPRKDQAEEARSEASGG